MLWVSDFTPALSGSRGLGWLIWAATIAAALTAPAVCPPAAQAESDGAINGTFIATSNGGWAKTNSVYRDEATVMSTWTITSSCTTNNHCDGQVTSDQGWTARAYTRNGLWYVRRELPGWQQCPDGPAATGHQAIRFYPVDPQTGQMNFGSTTFAGIDNTTGTSGACGRNAPVVIEMPFRLIPAP